MTSKDFEYILNDIFDKYNNKIVLLVSRARQSSKYSSASFHDIVNKSVSELLNEFQSEYLSTLEKQLKATARWQVDRFYKDIGKTAGIVDARKTAVGKVDKYLNAKSNYIKNQVFKMKQDISNTLKKDQVLISRYALVNGLSKKGAFEAVKDVVSSGEVKTYFKNRVGSNYSSRNYFELLSHSIADDFAIDTYADIMVSNGYDLARISSHGAKDRCAKWEGKVISITGSTEGYPSFADTYVSGDIWHPNCRHYLIPYAEAQ